MITTPPKITNINNNNIKITESNMTPATGDLAEVMFGQVMAVGQVESNDSELEVVV